MRQMLFGYPTGPLTILEHKYQENGEFCALQECLVTDFEAPNLHKARSGISPSRLV